MEALDVPEPSTGATVAERRLLWWRRILVNSVFVVAWYVLLSFVSSSGTGAHAYESGLRLGRRCVQIARAHVDPGFGARRATALARRRRQWSALLHALVDPLRALLVPQRPAASAHVVARQLEVAHILHRSYHISPASPFPSVLTARGRRRRGAKHDPDFRPFLPSRSPSSSSSSSCYSPPRASLDLPMPIVSASPPSKAERRAARRDLDPVLREAVRAHERQLAQARRPSWLSRRKPDDEDAPVFEDDDVDDYDYDTPVPETPKRAPRRDRIRLQLVSLELRVDLAVFRAKKRLRARLGLS